MFLALTRQQHAEIEAHKKVRAKKNHQQNVQIDSYYCFDYKNGNSICNSAGRKQKF